MLVSRFGGRVPTTMAELLTLPGVGRKTANLVLILAFKSLENICVDTHVHRISNRLGWVRTNTPDETEQALYRATASRWWPYINLYLVTWGQNVCRPVYPRCGACAIEPYCPRVGVTVTAKR
jgi:endonuclease-3